MQQLNVSRAGFPSMICGELVSRPLIVQQPLKLLQTAEAGYTVADAMGAGYPVEASACEVP